MSVTRLQRTASPPPGDGPEPVPVLAVEAGDRAADATRLLRIQEVAEEVRLTPRSIRYYEEQGLLTPARSEGDYRLYDDADVERLRFIKGLRDDAGFSLAEIRQLLDDEAARRLARERMRSGDPAERRAAIVDTISRVERQIETLRAKAGRIETMTTEAERRLAHLREHLAELDPAGATAGPSASASETVR